jgi:hypothetical protein
MPRTAPAERDRREHECASVPRPDTGSHPSMIEKRIARSGPSQKFGTEMPTSAAVVAR